MVKSMVKFHENRGGAALSYQATVASGSKQGRVLFGAGLLRCYG